MKQKGSCFEGVLIIKPNTGTIMLLISAQPNCKIADLLCLAEIQPVHLKYYPNDLASS